MKIDDTDILNIQIKITKNGVSVDLNLSESLLVLNALATKKISLRGGAWSAIGKRVEKPLLIKIARDSDIFIADTLSDQNKSQLNQRKIFWLELKNHGVEENILRFKKIIDELKIPRFN